MTNEAALRERKKVEPTAGTRLFLQTLRDDTEAGLPLVVTVRPCDFAEGNCPEPGDIVSMLLDGVNHPFRIVREIDATTARAIFRKANRPLVLGAKRYYEVTTD